MLFRQLKSKIMTKNILVALSAAALLSSCGIYSKYEAKEEVPEGLFGAVGDSLQSTDDTTSMASLPWKEVFTDPQLQQLIDNVLANNIDMQTAQLHINEAQYSLRTSKLAYAPSLSFTPEGALGSLDGSDPSKTYSIPLTLQWQIDAFGSLRNQKRANQATVEQLKDVKQATQTALVANTASLYYYLLMLDRQLEIADSTATSWGETVQTMKDMMEAGLTNRASVAQMEGTYYSVLTQVADLKQSINSVQNSLCLLQAIPSQPIKRGKLEDQHIDVDISAGLPLNIIHNRPDVRAQERALETAFYTTNAARSSMYPNITLSGQAGWKNYTYTAVFNPAEFFWSAAASLVQPIFQNGQLRARLNIAKDQQEEAELAWTKTVLTVGNEVNEAIIKYQTAHEKTDLYAHQVVALYDALEATELMMEHGSTTYLEVLTARQTLLSALLSQVANKYSELSAIIDVYQSVGGGVN